MAVVLRYSNGQSWADIPLGVTTIDTVCNVSPDANKNIALTATNVGAIAGVNGNKITNTNDASSTTDQNAALVVAGGIACAKSIWGNIVHGAVWNDYAEYRHCADDSITPGTVLMEDGRGNLIVADDRVAGAYVYSDTFGFALGENDQNKTPVALAGRVLAKVWSGENRAKLLPGVAVCAGPAGTVRRMRTLEKILHPDCILGYVSEVPTYEIWHGSNDIFVNNRVWIRIK